jgi:5-methylcytosine-specific restriction protein A
MARTKGHGNPNWTRDETILALDLYFKSGSSLPSRIDPNVKVLSALLQSLPYHANSSKRESFRNADGVAFKIQNLHNVATGKGLGNVSEMDRKVWAEFGTRPDEVESLANLIRAGIKYSEALPRSIDSFEVDEEFFEGRVLTVLHKRRERHPALRRRLMEARQRLGKLKCDLCSAFSISDDPFFEDATFEAHHTLPLAAAMERTTRLTDVALLCASCHRLVHRAISVNKRWLSIGECGELLRRRSNRA